MKLIRTASPAVVIECQRTFGFLPITLQILIRTAKFLLQQITVSVGYFIVVLLICWMTFSVNIMYILLVSLWTE